MSSLLVCVGSLCISALHRAAHAAAGSVMRDLPHKLSGWRPQQHQVNLIKQTLCEFKHASCKMSCADSALHSCSGHQLAPCAMLLIWFYLQGVCPRRNASAQSQKNCWLTQSCHRLGRGDLTNYRFVMSSKSCGVIVTLQCRSRVHQTSVPFLSAHSCTC